MIKKMNQSETFGLQTGSINIKNSGI